MLYEAITIIIIIVYFKSTPQPKQSWSKETEESYFHSVHARVFSQTLGMRTARMKEDKETQEDKQKRVKMKRSKVGTKKEAPKA